MTMNNAEIYSIDELEANIYLMETCADTFSHFSKVVLFIIRLVYM